MSSTTRRWLPVLSLGIKKKFFFNFKVNLYTKRAAQTHNPKPSVTWSTDLASLVPQPWHF